MTYTYIKKGASASEGIIEMLGRVGEIMFCSCGKPVWVRWPAISIAHKVKRKCAPCFFGSGDKK